jgi:ribonucleoside-diphosphate reductase alpha chain
MLSKKNNYGMDVYQQFIFKSRYSKWIEEENRREEWPETVARYFNFFSGHLAKNHNYSLTDELRSEIEEAILNLEVMPSMRALMTAGPALERDNIAGYNCSFLPIDRTTAFDEILYILMNGTGVGFSVERQFVSKLPEIADEFFPTDTTIVVADSKLGWAKALKELIHLLYGGQIPKWDTSKLRPAGARLKTFGGRSSGPAPLEDLFRFAVRLFRNAAGRKLTSVEAHDLVCKIAQIVVVGGVRRSALISLSNLSDDRMRNAKSGQWWEINPQRSIANNSAAYTEKPEIGIFMEEWLSLYRSKSGERGVFNRVSANKQVAKYGRREPDKDWGVNPCGEIILRPYEFCNLSEVVVRPTDTLESLKRKVRLATILGTFQSTLTDFKYINKKWKQNCDEERLLGVSLTGIMDHEVMNGSKSKVELISWLQILRQETVDVNKEIAAALGIPPSAAITTVKPSGTISQLTDAASGIHTRHSPYYIRTVRADKKDPLAQMMVDMGFPVEDDVMNPNHNYVFSFPIKSPEGAVFRDSISAITHLEIWKIYRTYWTEHNPSITITVKEDEWFSVGAWVYANFDDIGGVSFLPHSDHSYQQAPYQECTAEEYEKLLAVMPTEVDWSTLSKYETEDKTSGSQELSCVAGNCEIVDLLKA